MSIGHGHSTYFTVTSASASAESLVRAGNGRDRPGELRAGIV